MDKAVSSNCHKRPSANAATAASGGAVTGSRTDNDYEFHV